MTLTRPAENITLPVRPEPDAEAFLEKLQTGNRAFAALAEAIKELGSPAAKEPPTPGVEPCP